MNKRLQSAAALLLVSLLMLPFTMSSPLSVSLDKGVYRPGETVTLRIRGRPNTSYGIQVMDPQGGLVAAKQLSTGSDGTASFSFILPPESRLGTYTVHVAGGGEYVSITFQVEAAPPPPAPPPPAPAVTAAAAMSTAKNRFQLLLGVFYSLNQSLSLLDLEGVLADVFRGISEVNITLRETDVRYAAGDYAAASDLASTASASASRLMNLAFELAVKALKNFSSGLRKSTSDRLALALLNISDELLEEVSPVYVDASLRNIDTACKVLLAVSRLIDAAQLEEKVNELSGKLNETERSLEVALRDLGELRARVNQIESENQRLRASFSEAESALLAARSELERLRAENQQLRARNAELEQQVADAYSQASTARILAVVLLVVGLAIGFAVGHFVVAKRKAA